MTGGILMALFLICTLLAFLVGASAALFAAGALARSPKRDLKNDDSTDDAMREQWANFLSYDGNKQ